MSSAAELLDAGIKRLCWEDAGSPADKSADDITFFFDVLTGDYGEEGWIDFAPSVSLYYKFVNENTGYSSMLHGLSMEELLDKLF